MCKAEGNIGVFDSGVGGISVLKELLDYLPNERFIYYADTANAPYGSKTIEEVKSLSLKAATYLVEEKKVKALVVACNTATSVAVDLLRQKFSLPIIGMEPALKPAVEVAKSGNILVMATPLTLREKKFQRLMSQYKNEAQIITLPCSGLVELIEAEVTEGPKLHSYLRELFAVLDTQAMDVVILGCTHYLFVRKEVVAFFRPEVLLVDGNLGTARQVKRLLDAEGLVSLRRIDSGEVRVDWFSSGTDADKSVLQRFFLKL